MLGQGAFIAQAGEHAGRLLVEAAQVAGIAPIGGRGRLPLLVVGPVAGLDYFRARAIRESYLARLAKIEFEEKTAQLVSRDEVQVAAFTRARTVRDNLLNIPDRLAATLAAESDADKVHQILTGKDIVVSTTARFERYRNVVNTVYWPAAREGRILYERAA